MAGFRRYVNQNYSENENSGSHDGEFYEESQHRSLYMTRPQSYVTPSFSRTSTPLSTSFLLSRFPMHGFPAPFITPGIGFTISSPFAPSSFEQYRGISSQQSTSRSRPRETPSTSATVSTVPSAAASQRGRSCWTTAQTDVLVNAWREAFVELESHKNPRAWKEILNKVNKAGGKRTLDQVKKRLSYLKDKYKDAKAKNKRSGETRNTPRYYDVFDEVLGARSVVQLGEVRGTGIIDVVGSEMNTDVDNSKELDVDEQERNVQEDGVAVANPQPQRKKKKKASKSSTVTQLAECLTKLQQQQEDTMSRFLEGMQRIEESSRKHTSDVLLQVAELFAKRNRKEHDDDSDLE